MTDFQFVDPAEPLPNDLVSRNRIGVDTEFMREKTFFAVLCLVQVATPRRIYLADPLQDHDLTSFWDEILGKTWVLHSARQDLEVVSQLTARMPTAIFDTQVGAGLLGMAPQIGYANLVKELFDVDMAKSHTRADWTRRPLPHGLLQYAAEDVEHLLPLYDALTDRLARKGRLEWARQDSASLLDPALYEIDPAQSIVRLKGARNLRGRARAAAERLAAWRESEALKRDRPRQWIARDGVLMELATRRPNTMAELSKIDGLSPKLARRAGRELLNAIAASDGDNNSYRPPAPPNENEKALLKDMQAVVAESARDLDIAPETIASKKELSALIITRNSESRLLGGWRRELLGDRLERLL